MKSMLRTISILLLVSCLAEAALAARDNGQSAEDGTEISLSVGGQKVISASGVANFSEGTPGIIQVKVPDDGRRLVLSGLRPGSTTLLLIYQGGKQETLNISVYPRAPAVVRNELKQLVTAYSGIEVREVGG